MFNFIRVVAESIAEVGLKGLASMVPGGTFALAVAESVLKRVRAQPATETRRDIEALVQASGEATQAAVETTVREVLPAGVATRDDIHDLEVYLTRLPEQIRQSLKRPEDPSGKTAPAAFALTTPAEVAALLPHPPKFRPGAAVPGLDGWMLVRPLGVGGFGEVWYARHEQLEALHGAVKFCFGDSAQALVHEAGLIDRVMKAGDHPNIVRLRNARLVGDTPWLLFDYVGGEGARDWPHLFARMPPAERLEKGVKTLRQLASAVAFFHGLNPPVVHRDLKPSNILFDRVTMRFRITDFGIGSVTAKEALADGSGGRLLTSLHGSHTPLYASPQQKAGGPPDPRDDVHALGVIAYQILTGHLAHGAGPDFVEDLRDIGAGEELIALLGKCVSQRSERRVANAMELKAALAALPTTKPVAGGEKAAGTTVVMESSETAIAGSGSAAADRGDRPAGHRRGVRLVSSGVGGERGGEVVVGTATRPHRPMGGSDARRQREGIDTRGRVPPVWGRHGPRRRRGPPVAPVRRRRGHRGRDAHGRPVPRRRHRRGPRSGRALRWYRAAATTGNTLSMVYAGDLHRTGDGLPVDLPLSLRCYRTAATAGSSLAMCRLGTMFHDGSGVSQDYGEVLRWFQKAADAKDTAGMRELGTLYYYGHGVDRDYLQAMVWYQRAAALGNADAMNDIGYLYQHGEGVATDTLEAQAWFERGATAGSSHAMTNLGDMHFEGIRGQIRKHYRTALEWYQRAADAGNAYACHQLGWMHQNAFGIDRKDYPEALRWYRLGADRDDADSMSQLAWFHEEGVGTPEDLALALEWYEKAEAAGRKEGTRDVRRVRTSIRRNMANPSSKTPSRSEVTDADEGTAVSE